ncbi:23S rRNA (adenine(2030)-N(6))-methyltransferase RlmJ [Marinobacter halophilus]|uniref:Ribosomal RNA large subunit methyltransferase J n=1 Tax=Marinobacter halophilus TaxID=1323740 RepID=A0A2T1KCV0_9GAMM|nr:23S rRNA (adenine(2030)-N(6))-methyltransferase RlmJ [Marinobacter halophilus]PSF07951.1 23S rRNA (adenine(2030)-N(6))-methyltransferase RlmJ [Marinobacter halophilus]GGC58483.1 ribosomal RNA large subunit methyltransferase J [Marinobacter halophilus]
MLSYLHAFHAGNFADVQKHAALTLALTMMQAKSSPIACFDTHAGSALYDLTSERARKTAEADSGIHRLWPFRQSLASADWQPMLDILSRHTGSTDQMRSYPGSPAWFAEFARPGDSVTAFELHPTEGRSLETWATGAGVRVMQQDGLSGLLKRLPPTQPRLLTLIDPSYEIKDDYAQVADTLTRAWQKCRHGVYLVWYPVLTNGLEKRLVEALENGPVRKILRCEVMLDEPPERGMVGSGMLIVNPPWGFEQRLEAMMNDLQGSARLGLTASKTWLVPE